MMVKLIRKLGSTLENNSKKASAGIALVALVVMGFAIKYVDVKRTEQHHAQERVLSLEKLEYHSTLLELQLNRMLSHTDALRSFVLSRLKSKELINEDYFIAFAETLPNTESVILGLQLSPDAIINFVFPLSDKYLIGIDLQNHTKYSGTVNRAILSKKMLVDGPRMLSQGVLGLVARRPIFYGEGKFWGFSAVVIDFEGLLKASKLQEITHGLQLAIKGTHGKGSDGELFFGNTKVFDLNPILVDIVFQNGSWQMAGIPENGWSEHWPERNEFILISVVISWLLTYMIWQHSQHRFNAHRTEKRIRELATKDSLTNLANRRTLQEHLTREVKRAARGKFPLSILMIDIDYFKNYNDQFGHLEGDNCICWVANEVSMIAHRPTDLAARYGGEEFVLILPETPLEEAIRIAEKLCLNIASKKIPHSSDVTLEYVSVSIGVASNIPTVDKVSKFQGFMHSLLGDADKCLYRAKKDGRNRVCGPSNPADKYFHNESMLT